LVVLLSVPSRRISLATSRFVTTCPYPLHDSKPCYRQHFFPIIHLTIHLQKLRARQAAAPAESATVQDLVRNELKEKKHTATEGCLWLVRGLDFTAQGLEKNVNNPSEELADSFRGAYTNTLKPHHSFMVKPIFSAAMSAVPYRKDFYAKLGENPEQVQTELQSYLAAFTKIVNILKEFINSPEAKW
jgi:hypothetical protein